MAVMLVGTPAAAYAHPRAVAAEHVVAGPVVREAPTETAALAAAKESGERVEVAAGRSEFTQVFAEPDGRLTLESAVVPQRARRADGSWAPIDLRLGRGSDGLWRPAVSVADVRFSGGGTGPLVRLVRAGKTLTLSWPEALPVPAVSGESATYTDVLPDVDLVVRATWTGFTHVLVVKSAVAAADPAVRRLDAVGRGRAGGAGARRRSAGDGG